MDRFQIWVYVFEVFIVYLNGNSGDIYQIEIYVRDFRRKGGLEL